MQDWAGVLDGHDDVQVWAILATFVRPNPPVVPIFWVKYHLGDEVDVLILRSMLMRVRTVR